MVYLVYKTTNIVNGKFYIGCHATSDIDDGYIGSGKLLKRAISKYGKENFHKEILAVFDTPEDMFQMETMLVNEDCINNPDTYNMGLGGSGGSRVRGEHPTHSLKHMAMMRQKRLERLEDPEAYANLCAQMRNLVKQSHDNGNRNHTYFGQCSWHFKAMKCANSLESRAKRKQTRERIKFQQGENNSQYGTMWITDGKTNRKIKKTDPVPDNWRMGRTMVTVA